MSTPSLMVSTPQRWGSRWERRQETSSLHQDIRDNSDFTKGHAQGWIPSSSGVGTGLLLLSYQGGGATGATEALHNQQLHFCKLGVQVWMHLSGNSAPPLRNCFLYLDINFSFTPSEGGIFIYWSLEQFLHYVCHCSAKINLIFDYR